MIYSGQKFAHSLEVEILKQIKANNFKMKLAIWLDETNLAGKKYVQKKVEMAQRLGVEIVLNKIDGDEDGIMVQLPHPHSDYLVSQIPLDKDVDGLRQGSKYWPAIVRAVHAILQSASLYRKLVPLTTLVIGNRGFVGSKIQKILECDGLDKDNFDLEKIKNADVVISCTGQAGLIKPEMVKQGVVAIDVGYPKGDFDPPVAAKASFFTPVPGGVGPVTVAMLFANLLDAAISSKTRG